MDTELTSHTKLTVSCLCLKSENKKCFLLCIKLRQTYQTNEKCSDFPPVSIMLNLLIFEWVEKTDLAQSMFKKTYVIMSHKRKTATEILYSCFKV